MRFIRDTTELSAERDSAVTLGKFDGLHRGHRLLISEVTAAANEGLQSIVFTFGTHPRALVEGRPQELLLTNEERHDRLEALGLDLLIEYPFNETTSHILAEDFVRDILVRQLRARKIVVGTDFGFGYRRAGNVKLLCSLSKECGFELVVREKLKTKEGIDISSSYIKERLKRGEMEAVHALLGYPFFIRGIVRHGNRNGRTFGFPTINQFPEEKKLLPPNGVYVSRTIVDGQSYQSITNIGVKPTIGGEYPRGAETFIEDFSQDIYGKTALVELYSFLRPEVSFGSENNLIAQIKRDRQSAEKYWREESQKRY